MPERVKTERWRHNQKRASIRVSVHESGIRVGLDSALLRSLTKYTFSVFCLAFKHFVILSLKMFKCWAIVPESLQFLRSFSEWYYTGRYDRRVRHSVVPDDLTENWYYRPAPPQRPITCKVTLFMFACQGLTFSEIGQFQSWTNRLLVLCSRSFSPFTSTSVKISQSKQKNSQSELKVCIH